MRFILLLFASFPVFAAIPKGTTILNKLTDNSGLGIYRIEQEVLFQNEKDRVTLKEIWWVENENTLKLQILGLKEFKDKIKITYLYQGKNKLINLSGSRKVVPTGADFSEKFFHFRKSENLAFQLSQMGILNSTYLQKKIAKNIKDFDPTPDPLLRLARHSGVVSYVFGPVGGASGLWVEQDQFVIRKIRFQDGAEVLASEVTPFAKGLIHPKQKIMKLMGSNFPVSASVQSVSWRGEKVQNFFSSTSLENSSSASFEGLPLQSTIEEFYSRFR